MKASSRRISFLVAYITIAGSLWVASQWWEKGLAKNLGDPAISPNGCYRIEAYKPFWVLPNIFHPESDPNEDRPPKWFPWWGYPVFFKLYNHRSGELISETNIYDLEPANGKITWGRASRTIFVGMIPVGPTLPDCKGDNPSG